MKLIHNKDQTIQSVNLKCMFQAVSSTGCEIEAYLRGSTATYGNLFGSGKEKRRNMSEMLEKILSNENIKLAQKKVYSNKGASGVDGVTVQELEEYMKENWNGIKEQIRERKYKPQPVLRGEIPKPNGGVRKLGINPWQAKLTAGLGNRYMLASKMPVVKKAISKEKLTKRGLISLSDYYAKVHI